MLQWQTTSTGSSSSTSSSMPPKKAAAAKKKPSGPKKAINKAAKKKPPTKKKTAAKKPGAKKAAGSALEAIWAAGSLGNGGPASKWTLESPNYQAAVKAGKKPLHLAYFAIRALGELQKLCLEYSKVPYKCDVVLSGPVFSGIKESLPFGRLPVIYDFDGKGGVLTQSDAVVRYVAKQCGMAGADEREAAVIDMLYMEWKDHKQDFAALGEGGDLKTVPDWNKVPNGHDLTKFQAAVSGLRIFEKVLKTSKTGWLSGGKRASYADLALWMTLFEAAEEDNCGEKWAATLKLPALKKFKAKVESSKALMAYLKSDRLMPRMGAGYVYKAGKFSEPR